VLLGGEAGEWVDWIGGHLFRGTPQEVIAEDSLLLAVGAAASALGTWWFDAREGKIARGLGWLMGAVVVLSEVDPGEIEPVLDWLEAQKGIYAMGLQPGAILAVGPGGELEVWGDQAPTVLLGRGWEKA